MAKGVRFSLLTACITVLCVKNAYSNTKIVEGTLSTTENWAFITSFLYKPSLGRLRYHFEYPLSYATQNVMLYFDNQWPSVYPQPGMSCVDREKGVHPGKNQIINLTANYIWSGCSEKDVLSTKYFICDGDRVFHTSGDRWWYIALSNCVSTKGLLIKYTLKMTYGAQSDNRTIGPQDHSASIKCYHCTSTKSWDDCERVYGQSTANCTGKDSVCFNVHYTKGGNSQFERSCGTKIYCQKKANPICGDDIGSSQCNSRCCHGDMCNAGLLVRVSTLLIAAGVATSLMKQ